MQYNDAQMPCNDLWPMYLDIHLMPWTMNDGDTMCGRRSTEGECGPVSLPLVAESRWVGGGVCVCVFVVAVWLVCFVVLVVVWLFWFLVRLSVSNR